MKLKSAVTAGLLTVGAVISVPVGAGTASADPSCIVSHSESWSGGYFYVNVSSNPCGQPIRALVQCSDWWGNWINRGSSITTGTTRAEGCASSYKINQGYDKYVNGAWLAYWEA